MEKKNNQIRKLKNYYYTKRKFAILILKLFIFFNKKIFYILKIKVQAEVIFILLFFLLLIFVQQVLLVIIPLPHSLPAIGPSLFIGLLINKTNTRLLDALVFISSILPLLKILRYYKRINN